MFRILSVAFGSLIIIPAISSVQSSRVQSYSTVACVKTETMLKRTGLLFILVRNPNHSRSCFVCHRSYVVSASRQLINFCIKLFPFFRVLVPFEAIAKMRAAFLTNPGRYCCLCCNNQISGNAAVNSVGQEGLMINWTKRHFEIEV